MNNTNLEMTRENTFSFDIAVTENEVPVNLTNGTLRMTAKWAVTDADASAVFQKSSPSTGITFLVPASGTANITIVEANTTAIPYHEVDLVYDIKFTDASGNEFTVMRGTLRVLPNVTRT